MFKTLFRHIINFVVPPIKKKPSVQVNLNTVLQQERERILTGLLRVVTILGFVTVIATIPASIHQGYWILFGVYSLFLGLLATITLNRQLAYRLRAGLFLFIVYTVGLLDLLNFGLAEDGRIYLFGFCVTAIILMGESIGLSALGLSLFTIGLVGWLISTGQFDTLNQSHIPSAPLTLETVIITSLVFFLMTGLVMAALYTLLRSFEIAWQRERTATNALQEERNLLEMRVTERTQELRQARDQALEASRLKAEFLAKVSHELRTPLGVILGYAELLQVGIYGEVSDKQNSVLGEIIDSAHYQTTLVNELLDLAQLDAGRLVLNITNFAPAEIINALTKLLPLAKAKGLHVSTHIADDMPAQLQGDLTRLQQILLNLMGNAIKFTDSGKVSIHLAPYNSSHWSMRVSDTGCGIPAKEQVQIFEPFGQVDGSATREHSGTGLGLSIVKHLVTLMNGQIILESEVGQGSTFTVILPLQTAETL